VLHGHVEEGTIAFDEDEIPVALFHRHERVVLEI
jgi:hypothetical protein